MQTASAFVGLLSSDLLPTLDSTGELPSDCLAWAIEYRPNVKFPGSATDHILCCHQLVGLTSEAVLGSVARYTNVACTADLITQVLVKTKSFLRLTWT